MKPKTTSGSTVSVTRSIRRTPGKKPDATVVAPVVPAIVPGRLHDVVNDTKNRAFCGPMAVAAITGEPVSRVRDAFRLVRHGAGWTEYDRAPSITGRGTMKSSAFCGCSVTSEAGAGLRGSRRLPPGWRGGPAWSAPIRVSYTSPATGSPSAAGCSATRSARGRWSMPIRLPVVANGPRTYS